MGETARGVGSEPGVGDPIELAGVARGSGKPLLAFSRVTVGGSAHGARQAGAFELETSDGHRIRVEPPRDLEHRLAPKRTHHGAWEDVELPLRDRHDAIAPAPNVRVRVDEAVVRDGDPVTVVGRVAEVGPAEHGAAKGYRTAPARTVVAITADFVGYGPDAADAAHRAAAEVERVAARPRDWSFVWRGIIVALMLIPVAVLVARWNSPMSREPVAWLGALAWWAAGAMWTRRTAPQRPTTDETVASGTVGDVFTVMLAMLSGGMLLVTATVSGELGVAPEVKGALAVLLVVPQAVLLVRGLVWLVPAVRFRSLFRARGDWRVIEGTLGADLNQSTGTLRVRTAAGDRQVVMKRVLRATEKIDVQVSGRGRFKLVHVYHRATAPGGVLVAGRFADGDRELRAKGERSLALFACEPGGDPRAVLARRVRSIAIMMVELVATLTASLVIVLR